MLLSFNPDVWRLSKRAWPGLQVRAQHVFGPPHSQAQASPMASLAMLTMDGPEPPWAFNHVSTLDEAIETLVDVLRSRSALSAATAFRQTSLRPWMGMVKPTKFAGNAASTRSSGMIGVLVRIAATRGLIEVGGRDPADLLMWLKPRGTPPQGQGASPQPTEPVSARQIDVPGDSLTARRGPAVCLTPKRPREPDKYTCDRMSVIIDRSRMGPFPVARPVVYQALQNCVDSKAELSFDALIEAAIQSARTSMPGLPQPWTAIRFVTARQLLRAGVVLDKQDKPLPNNWSSGSIVVHRLPPGWVQRAEGEILVALFAGQDVTGDQLADIARSVWGSSSAEALAKVRAVVHYLVEVDRVQEDDRGVFRVKRAQPVEQGTSQPAAANEAASGAIEPGVVESDRLVQ